MVSLKTGIADLPLHKGKCPPWLFLRMKKLVGSVAKIIVMEYGQKELLRKLADPFFFQALGCVCGYDWHSSGLTTTLTAALREGVDKEIGIAVLGGKGRMSKTVPRELEEVAEYFSFSSSTLEKLKECSRMSAKIDNVCVQDGYSLYHHSFIVSEKGDWVVVQQGMNMENKYARRYHWFSARVRGFVEEPHSGIAGEKREEKTLNMVSKENAEARKAVVDLVKENPLNLRKYFVAPNSLLKYLRMQPEHTFDVKSYEKIVEIHEFDPKDFEELVSLNNVGMKTIRALALMSHLIYGTPLSWKDPKIFSFAHGGKDGHPYPINRRNYDKTLQILEDAVKNAEIGRKEKLRALKKLKEILSLNK